MRLWEDVFQWHRSRAAVTTRIEPPALLFAETTYKPDPVFRGLPVMPPAPALPNSFDQPAILAVEVPQTGAHNDAA